MKDNRHKHKSNRSTRGFDNHASGAVARTTGAGMRKGRVWRFYDARTDGLYPFEEHFRTVSRTAAICGKHLRAVEEPVRSTHGKTL